MEITTGPTRRTTKYYLSVCAVFKNEAPGLSEWVEFHKAVGVEHFYLYNNNSEDDFLIALTPRISDGTVTLIDFPKHPGQLAAYDHCLSTFANEARWIAFLDIDEYLHPAKSTNLKNVLTNYESYPSVCVNLQIYGSSGRALPSGGLIIESFTRKGPLSWSRNRQIKSIVDPTRTIRSCDPHSFVLSGSEPAVTEHYKAITTSSSKAVTIDLIRINHYAIRSFVEFLAKRRRGRAGTNKKRALLHFARLDRNNVCDLSATAWADQIRNNVARVEIPKINYFLGAVKYIYVRVFAVGFRLKDWFLP